MGDSLKYFNSVFIVITMVDDARVEKSFGEDEEDIFDEAFGKDEEKEAARARMEEKVKEEKEKARKKKTENVEKVEGTISEPFPDDGPPIPEEPEQTEVMEVETVEEKAIEEEPEPVQKKKKAPKKHKIKEKIRNIVVAKAKEAAEKDGEEIPLNREAGTTEEGVKEKAVEKTPEAVEEAGAEAKVESVEKKPEKKKIVTKPEIKFLQNDDGQAFIGRKASVYKKYESEAGLFIGRVAEDEMRDKDILLDSLNPHVVFVCGARGSGKSYVMGVIAEEIALKNKNVGQIVVDPVGVFWSMRFPNRETRELELLGKWDLLPQGLDNLKVFVPKGVKDKVPKKTYDATFSLPPSMLTAEDWCLTFGIERFSPSGLLLEKTIQEVEKGYKTKEGKTIKGKGKFFSLENLVDCLGDDAALTSSDTGYKPDSLRALSSRFDAAKSWGVFDPRGTPLSELSRENQLTIIDTSFLEDNVSALVIGILARRVLSARKLSTRKEAANRMKEQSMDQLLEEDIPPTWLFIDEAHTLIPSGNVKTPASTPIIEYVKQGRQPGCSLVFATQQPSAIDTKVLSQLDTIITHKLVFDDDIKAVYKRTPTIIPKKYKNSNFIKTLPVGVGLTGDRREETARAFIMRIRPRMSQHEGREAETVERSFKLGKGEVLRLAVGMTYSKLERMGTLETTMINEALRSLNVKYKSNVSLGEVIEQLEKKGAILNAQTSTLTLPGAEHEEALVEEISGEVEKEIAMESKAVLQPEPVELLAFPTNLSQENASKIINKTRKKKFLGLIGTEEAIEKLTLRHLPIYHVKFNVFNDDKSFHKGEVFVDSGTGELMHFDKQRRAFVKSNGFGLLNGLKEGEIKTMLALGKEKREFAALAKQIGESEMISKRLLEALVTKGIAAKEKVAETSFYFLAKEIDLPKDPLHPLLRSLESLPVSMAEALSLEIERVPKQKAIEALSKLWNKLVVTDVKDVYLPFYESILKLPDGKLRMIRIEAVNGTVI
jgi:predicted transcriptional regulator